MGNVFIWTAFEHYLRQPTDSYILFSPVKYWKAQYNPSLTYGEYQISEEIDLSHNDAECRTVWENIEVHSALQTLKALVMDYYSSKIVPTLFEYEFLK